MVYALGLIGNIWLVYKSTREELALYKKLELKLFHFEIPKHDELKIRLINFFNVHQ